MNKKMLPSIIGKNNEFMFDNPILGEGGFSNVYDLVQHKGLVLKHSYYPHDGFRYLASLSASKRRKIGLRPIQEVKRYGDDAFYLMKKLYPIPFTEDESKYLDELSLITEVENIFYPESFISARIDFVVQKIKALIFILKDEKIMLDITKKNIMMDENEELYLTDPVSEIID